MSVSQSTASATILDKMDNIMTQNQALHDSQTKSNSTLQKFLDMSVHPMGASTGQTSTAPGHGSESPAESITRNGMLASRRITTENPEIIGKIIRAELRQQLEPLAGRLDGMKELVNSLTASISGQTHLLDDAREETCFRETSSSGSSHTTTSMIRYHQDSPDGSIASGRRNTTTVRTAPRKREALLYTKYHYIESRIGEIQVIIQAYRQCGLLAKRKGRYFRLKVAILPRPWLFSKGMSIMGSNGPNAHGHYDICPSIMPFRIIPSTSPTMAALKNVLYDDDLPGFQKLLFDGVVTLRDVAFDGSNLLWV